MAGLAERRCLVLGGMLPVQSKPPTQAYVLPLSPAVLLPAVSSQCNAEDHVLRPTGSVARRVDGVGSMLSLAHRQARQTLFCILKIAARETAEPTRASLRLAIACEPCKRV